MVNDVPNGGRKLRSGLPCPFGSARRITGYGDGLGFWVNCDLNLGLKMNFRDS
jgi:hypothetical protein